MNEIYKNGISGIIFLFQIFRYLSNNLCNDIFLILVCFLYLNGLWEEFPPLIIVTIFPTKSRILSQFYQVIDISVWSYPCLFCMDTKLLVGDRLVLMTSDNWTNTYNYSYLNTICSALNKLAVIMKMLPSIFCNFNFFTIWRIMKLFLILIWCYTNVLLIFFDILKYSESLVFHVFTILKNDCQISFD